MKDLITIYEDEQQTIEVHPQFFLAYEELLTPFYRVGAGVQDLLIGLAAEAVIEKNIASPEDILVCSRKIYILEENQPIRLEKAFEMFQETLDYIVSTPDFLDHLKTIEEKINEEGEFFCEIFDRAFYDVNGYLCKVKKGKIYLLFFTCEEVF